MKRTDIESWCSSNQVTCEFEKEYSDDIEKDVLLKQSVESGETIYQGERIVITYSLGKEPSTELKNALKKAESYSENMYMSKQAIYEQLVSEYGEQFPEDTAQYAIDNLEADWNYNALKSAESYSENLHMSKQGIYDQLVSEYGDQFSKEQAQYAIDHIEADWNANALASAKSYQDTMNMSKNAIYDQLISQYGEKFTKDEAQYAIDHLDD